jgi:hypothetical protein
MRPFGVLVVLWVAVVACAQGQDKLLLQIPRDGKIEPKPLEERDFRIVEGKAIQFGPAGILRFGGEGLLDRARGTVCMWIKPDWNAAEESSHALFSDDRKFETGNNSLTLWE